MTINVDGEQVLQRARWRHRRLRTPRRRCHRSRSPVRVELVEETLANERTLPPSHHLGDNFTLVDNSRHGKWRTWFDGFDSRGFKRSPGPPRAPGELSPERGGL